MNKTNIGLFLHARVTKSTSSALCIVSPLSTLTLTRYGKKKLEDGAKMVLPAVISIFRMHSIAVSCIDLPMTTCMAMVWDDVLFPNIEVGLQSSFPVHVVR